MQRLRELYPHADFPRTVRIVEVSPRDGLQNEKRIVDTSTKIQFIQSLVYAGMTDIELTSFVSPKWVPQLADATELVTSKTVSDCAQGTNFSALVPNLRGMSDLLATGRKLQQVAVFASATESFSRRNLNCGVEQSLERFKPVVAMAKKYNLRVRAYISCIIACPYEGQVDPASVARLAAQFYSMGVDEIALADTIGAGDPQSITRVVDAVIDAQVPVSSLAIHCHDTNGNALANVLAALSRGIATIDASVGGLGGCPFAPNAPGNLATEDLIALLRTLGIDFGPINLDTLVETGRKMCKYLGREPTARVQKTQAHKSFSLSDSSLTDHSKIVANVLQQLS